MSRYNTSNHRARPLVATVTSPMGTVSQTAPDTRTHNGAAGWTKTPQTELFLRLTSAFSGRQKSFYEDASTRDTRLVELTRQLAVEDPEFVFNLAVWARTEGNIRTGAIMVAVEFARARLAAGLHGTAGTRVGDPGEQWATVSSRALIDAVCRRADEPGEVLAYWMAQYGRRIPKPVKRGLADASARLYTQRNLLKYDTASHGVRFADVLELCHTRPALKGVTRWEFLITGSLRPCPTPEKIRFPNPVPKRLLTARDGTPLAGYLCRCGWYHRTSNLEPYGEQLTPEAIGRSVVRRPTDTVITQGALFKYAIDRRHGNDKEIPEKLSMIQSNRDLRQSTDVNQWLSPSMLYSAGVTWEDALSAVGSKVDKRKLWEAMIPSMGYMALLRNLRNFDQAGVSDTVAAQVAAKLADPEEVKRGKQFPFRYLAAYQNAPSLRWAYPLETALGHSLANVPPLPGRTLILVDRSGSMWSPLSDRSELNRADAAAIFGTALAVRAADADLIEYGTTYRRVNFRTGESVLKIVERFGGLGGTDTVGALRAHYKDHDRVVIVTDEQYSYSRYGLVGDQVPATVPIYTWNLAGYTGAHTPSGADARFTFGGLTDKAFTLIPLMEAGRDGVWPWELADA